ncbi:MAG: divergent polysaccharide deacetylase family protein [Syntrophales bacterium]|nr:divergent polysaccharide deacetylase family protein [Syntrophales bacterium]
MKKKKRYSKKPAQGRAVRSRGRSLAGWICILALIGAVASAGYILYHRGDSETAKIPYTHGKGPALGVVGTLEEHESAGPKESARKKAGVGGRVAFVIDDMGYDVSILDEILAIDAPITISILPHLPYSVAVARQAHRAGKEVLLHLPMEPHGYPEIRPGSGVLLLQMDDNEIVDQLEEDMRSVPHMSGVNNHMGSRFMEDEEKVTIVLKDIKGRGFFFLDSLTTKDSKGLPVAERIGLPHAGRDIFLDNDCDFGEALDILHHIVEERDMWETMIIIGHPHESTIRAIGAVVPVFRDNDIRIVPLSDLIE